MACAAVVLALAALTAVAPAAHAAGGADVTRIAGDTRLDTAAKAAAAGFPGGSDNVIVASAENWPDALSASGLAGLLECPVVLTESAQLSDQAADTIKSLGATSVYVVGGEAAVSDKAFSQVQALPGVEAVRLAGADRFGTCKAIYDAGAALSDDGANSSDKTAGGDEGSGEDAAASGDAGSASDSSDKTAGGDEGSGEDATTSKKPLDVSAAAETSDDSACGWSSTALLVRGTGYADALAIAPYAYASGSPVLLAGPDGKLPASLQKIASSDAFDSAVVLGGTAGDGAVTDEAAESLGKIWCRIAGKDRMQTSEYVAKWATGGYSAPKVKPSVELSYQGAGFARAWDFPDALAAVGALGPSGSVLMLLDESNGGETPSSVSGHLAETGATKAIVFGGEGAVPEAYADWLGMTLDKALDIAGFITVGGNDYFVQQDGSYARNKLVGGDAQGYRYAGADGVIMKNGIVGSDSAGFYYADANGVIDLTYRGAVEQGGERWLVLDGLAHRVSTDHDDVMWLAFKELETCTTPSMTKEQKLQAAFAHIRDDFKEYNPRIPHSHAPGWETLYAKDIFIGRGGNCISCAAAFAFMAKAIGYDNVYACNTGHAWAEIDGLVYDPEWARYTSTGMSYFGQSYDNQGDQAYLRRGAASAEPGMHVAI